MPLPLLILLVSLSLVAYAYLGYPLLIWACSRLFGRQPRAEELSDDQLPMASLLIAAHNEETVIAARIENALAIDYPREKLEIAIGSDGSSDATAAIVRRFADRGVRLFNYPLRRGKATVLNDSIPKLSGEIVLLSDANTDTDPQAARKLARWFVEPRVGAVCGRLVLTDPRTGRNVDSAYWKYETFLKKCEGRLGALLGANGAIYAIRRTSYVPIPGDTIIDDFVIPLLAKRESNCRIIYDADAVALEETPAAIGAEFRRCRIGSGGFQGIVLLGRLLSPRYGWLALSFLSHKVLRWLCPFFLIAMFVANMFLLEQPVFRATLVAQVAFYAVSVAGMLLPGAGRGLRLLRLTTMFSTMNLALLVGFIRWITGRQRGTWQRTAR